MDIGIAGVMRRIGAQGMARGLAAGLAVAGVVLAAGCGVKSTPARPGDYDYPGRYPAEVRDPIVPPGDSPTYGAGATYGGRQQDERRGQAPAYGETPPPATGTIVR